MSDADSIDHAQRRLAQLASELDEATARARALEAASGEVAQRIDQAIATIRGVLDFGD